jgi:hypothetical protein
MLRSVPCWRAPDRRSTRPGLSDGAQLSGPFAVPQPLKNVDQRRGELEAAGLIAGRAETSGLGSSRCGSPARYAKTTHLRRAGVSGRSSWRRTSSPFLREMPVPLHAAPNAFVFTTRHGTQLPAHVHLGRVRERRQPQVARRLLRDVGRDDRAALREVARQLRRVQLAQLGRSSDEAADGDEKGTLSKKGAKSVSGTRRRGEIRIALRLSRVTVAKCPRILVPQRLPVTTRRRATNPKRPMTARPFPRRRETVSPPVADSVAPDIGPVAALDEDGRPTRVEAAGAMTPRLPRTRFAGEFAPERIARRRDRVHDGSPPSGSAPRVWG